jgi:hypothetical protein
VARILGGFQNIELGPTCKALDKGMLSSTCLDRTAKGGRERAFLYPNPLTAIDCHVETLPSITECVGKLWSLGLDQQYPI